MTDVINVTASTPDVVVVSTPANTSTIVGVGVGQGGAVGPAGPKGETGPGVADGGTAGQVLTKITSANYNTQWTTLVTGVSSVDGFVGAVSLSSLYDALGAATTALNSAKTYADGLIAIEASRANAAYDAMGAAATALTSANASAANLYQLKGAYLTSYTETSTLQNVTSREATTSSAISITNTTQSTSYSTGSLILSGGLGVAKNLYVQGNVDITGNININGQITGSLTEINVTNLNVSDSLIYLADGNLTSDAIDIGFYGAYRPVGDTSGHKHTGLIRDHNDSGIWKLVSGGPESDSNDVDFGLNDVNVNFDQLKLRSLIVTDAGTTRTNLGVAIGTNVQAYNAALQGISTLGNGTGVLKNAAGTWSYDTAIYDTIVSDTAPSTTANVFWVDTTSTNTIASIFGGTP